LADATPWCSTLSRSDDEAGAGTSSRVRDWLLIQQPGPWGRDALTQSRLDAGLAQRLAAHARAQGVRVLLLRRHGRGASQARAQCYLAHTGPDASFVEGRRVDDLEELLDVNLARLRAGQRPGFGPLVERPLYLVCTNGRHDRCCAARGRPLAAALDAAYPEQVWEASHVGGCRFAGTVVCFPHGLYFGALDPADGLRVAERYERGLIDLTHFRGTPWLDPVAQAAESFVRRAEGLQAVGELALERREVLDGGDVAIGFRTRSGARYRARIATRPAPTARHLTCDAPSPLHPPVYALVDLSTDPAS